MPAEESFLRHAPYSLIISSILEGESASRTAVFDALTRKVVFTAMP
jgi:hypothetical protein